LSVIDLAQHEGWWVKLFLDIFVVIVQLILMIIAVRAMFVWLKYLKENNIPKHVQLSYMWLFFHDSGRHRPALIKLIEQGVGSILLIFIVTFFWDYFRDRIF
jgi:hypothetical protein